MPMKTATVHALPVARLSIGARFKTGISLAVAVLLHDSGQTIAGRNATLATFDAMASSGCLAST